MRQVRRSALLGVSLLVAGSAVTASCDTAKRVKARVVVVSFLLEIGDPFDLAPRQTGITANFMAIEGPLDEPEAVPLGGADAALNIEGPGGEIALAETGTDTGVYQAFSGTAGSAALVYTSGSDYTITLDVASGKQEGSYQATVNAPNRTTVTGLPDTQMGETIPANQALTLQVQGGFDAGIVVVLTTNGDVTYDNRPQDVQQAIDFVFGEFDGTIVIPAEAFPSPGTAYGIVVSGLESAPGSAFSTNLNILSRFYAGSGETAIVVTAP